MSKYTYNLLRGHPSAQLLPTKEIAAATSRVLLREDYTQPNEYDQYSESQTHPLQYGTCMN